ncbi:MAG TPA: hypothetical protein VF400_04420 [Anaeromyxobacteraceae bacterium]
MKRLLAYALLPAALALLTSCGGTACTSNAAQATVAIPQCTVGSGSTTTFAVALCAKCSDSNPSCQAELRPGNRIEVSPTIQQCQENAGCAVNGCNAQVPTATCTLNASLAPGSYELDVVGETQVAGTLTVAASGTSTCTL